ncbi:turripeptide Ici9.1-like [Lycorma delicatula]|uniref:turripeptide Ici9.1-like n=1 Tax=Lycorma delicatula TaxID=130591 RepID=UPI003F50D825
MDNKISTVTVLLVISLAFMIPVESYRGRGCPGFCSLEYKPICGRDTSKIMKTFVNNCAMNVENCRHHTNFKRIHAGVCRRM